MGQISIRQGVYPNTFVRSAKTPQHFRQRKISFVSEPIHQDMSKKAKSERASGAFAAGVKGTPAAAAGRAIARMDRMKR